MSARRVTPSRIFTATLRSTVNSYLAGRWALASVPPDRPPARTKSGINTFEARGFIGQSPAKRASYDRAFGVVKLFPELRIAGEDCPDAGDARRKSGRNLRSGRRPGSRGGGNSWPAIE